MYSSLIESILFFVSFARCCLLSPVCTTGIIIIILTFLWVCAISIVSPQCTAVLAVGMCTIYCFNVWNIKLSETVLSCHNNTAKNPTAHMLSWQHPSDTWSGFFGWKWSRDHRTFDDPCSNAKVVTNPFTGVERCSGFSYDLGFALCLDGDLDVVSHRSLDWTVTLQNSEYHSTPPLEQGKIVKIKVLNKNSCFFKILV